MFAEERPALGPLPLEPFRYYQYGRRNVHLDGCVEVAAAYYSAPPGWIGRRVDVQWNDAHVRLLDPSTGQRLREQLRAPRGWHRIADPDRPARTPPKTLVLLAAAKRAGPAISTICDHIHRHEGGAGVRRILGVLSLARKQGPAVAEDAATAALELGVPTYRFLKRYLDRRSVAPLSLRQVDPLIRQLTSTAISSTAEQETRHESRRTRPSSYASFASPEWPMSSKRGCSRPRPSRWRRSTCSRHSLPTSSNAARTGCSPGDTSRPDFRDPDRALFNKKINRALVFELATARFVAQREDALLIGPPGTGKSHIAQAIGRAAIQQGYRVIYRKAHTFLEELAEATLANTRKAYLAELIRVPLLIIDDLGMRKLPHTAAEDLLELIIRRYERASTMPPRIVGSTTGGSSSVTPPPSPHCSTACSITPTYSSAAPADGAPGSRPPCQHRTP